MKHYLAHWSKHSAPASANVPVSYPLFLIVWFNYAIVYLIDKTKHVQNEERLMFIVKWTII